MNNLTQEYEAAKKRAVTFMKNGQITQYFKTLQEINRFKKLMIAVVSN